MASPLPNVPKTTSAPFVPAGYLPAPKQARFISEAEQAAAKLPPTIKPESLKNALLKGGAKPVELEYAGIDDFIAQKIAKGERVTAADAQKFIQEQGPLGQLKRVEQQATPQTPGGQNPLVTAWENKPAGAVPPSYTQNVRSPFDASTASDQTMYHEYTVPGKQGDFAGYREVLIEDPKNRAGGGALVAESDPPGHQMQGPVNAHSSDYWARYNEYPDRIAVQNIQSDAGQEAVKGKNSFLEGLNRRMEEVRRNRQSLIDEINQGESTLTPSQRDEIESQIANLWSEEGEIFETAEIEGAVVFYDENGNEYFRPGNANSPLARDDNWKNLMARHIALQSLAGGGKPITIPTGKQMVDVEGFGLQTHHDNPHEAAIAATAYNEDLVRRLQKIFRGLDPSGAQVSRTPGIAQPAEKTRLPLPRPEDATMWERRFVHSDLLPPIRERAMRAMELADSNPDLFIWADNPEEMNPYGFFDPSVHDEMVRIAMDSADPEAKRNAMEALHLWRRAGEIGTAEKHARWANPQPPEYQPGWTITPAAKAVRAGLEKGLPILSLAPLLLAPAKQDNRR